MPFAVQSIRRALELGEFVPYFQPLVDLRAGKIHGFEVLARWENPTLGLVPPMKFIPLVEGYGLINKLSASLLTQALAAVHVLPKDFGLSFNLSPSQLHDRTLPDMIRHLADAAEFDLKRLTVELTETALVDDLNLAGAVAADFKRMGIRLSLDDFGTGYSSLLHLQALPFDELKVDISFVRSMVQSRQSRKITAAVVSLGLSLGLRTIAEGIEEQSQATLLAWQGCDLGQGYLYGRPVPAADLLASLSEHHAAAGDTTEVPASMADPFLSLDSHPTERLSQLRAIYDSAPVGLAFIDCDMRHVNLNQRLAAMNGQSVQAHLGRKVSEMVSPIVYEQFEPNLKRAIAGESVPPFEIRWPAAEPGGQAVTLLLAYQPVRNEAGEILGVCLSVVDISAGKQKEEALRESEDNYRNAVELSPQIPWTMEPDGTIQVSSRWTALTGLTQEQTSHKGWLNAVHEDDLERVNGQFDAAVRTGTAIDLEFRVCDIDGAGVWVRAYGAPRRNAAGEIVRWYGSVESIDNYKRALDELRCSETRLRAIFEAVPVGIVLAESSTGEVLQANPWAEELIGFHFEPGMVWTAQGWEAFDSSGRPIDGSNLPLTRTMRSGESTGVEEVLLRRPDGSKIWLSLMATPIHLENGVQLGGVLVVQSIDGKRDARPLLEIARGVSSAISGRARNSPNQAA
jgi:PAS domain S-box-containing protein